MFKNLCLVFDHDDKDKLSNNDMGTKNEMISDEKRVSTLKRKPHDKPTLSREVLLVIWRLNL